MQAVTASTVQTLGNINADRTNWRQPADTKAGAFLELHVIKIGKRVTCVKKRGGIPVTHHWNVILDAAYQHVFTTDNLTVIVGCAQFAELIAADTGIATCKKPD